MKSLSSRPFSCFQMTRRALSIAATAAALLATNNAFADETASVEQPKSDASSAVESTPVTVVAAPEGADGSVVYAPLAPPVVEEPVEVPAPVAPVTMPAFNAPRFAPMTMQQDRPLEAPAVDGKKNESFRIGGMVGVGFPRPFAAEGFVKIKQVIGVGVEYSFLPNTSIASTDIRFKGIALDVRVFPFKGGVFVGLRGGKQWLDTRTTVATGATNVPGVAPKYNEAMSAETFFLNPRIGYLKTFENGITVGLDAGIQLPISPSYTRDSEAARAGYGDTDAEKTLRTVANTLGNKTTPTIDLLRVGFLF